MELRPLRPEEDRSRFHSGDAELDRFFHRFAGQNQFKHHLGVTYVGVEEGRILGFATVAPGEVEVDRIPSALRKGLPRYPSPVLRLGRLAVDAAARGKGLGAALLRFTLQLAARMSDDYGCVGVLVDAKPGAVDFYRRYGFVPLEVLEGGSEARPVPVVMFLSLRAINQALGSG